MSERKAINKYYPPDFDPSKIPKSKKKKNEVIKVRLQTPFSMRCVKCNEYISLARKFNARKEVTKEKYLNVSIIRFHIKCPICNNPITFKTHPQSGGFVPETGALRNFEPKNKPSSQVPVHETEDEILERLLREDKQDQKFQDTKSKREKNPFYKAPETDGNSVADPESLEQKFQQQQRQHEIDEHLQYLQAKNSRIMAKGTRSDVIDNIKSNLHQTEGETEEEETDKVVKEAFKKYQSKRPLLEEAEEPSGPQPLVIKRAKVTAPAQAPTPPVQATPATKGPPATKSLVEYSSSDED